MNILLVWPRTPDTFWSFRHVMPFVRRRAAIPPLGLLTIAAMLPGHWRLRLIDLNVAPLTDADIDWADCVFLSGMLVQASSAHTIIARCRARGRTLLAGGPLFTTGHERFAELQHVVIGEAEDLMPQVVADLTAGRLAARYESSSRPDITCSPIPRWDLVSPGAYVTMPIQVSRGCPFNCEFCDIIVMNGRVPRVKRPEQVIAELDSLVDAGLDEAVFIVDDNFIGNKVRVKALLRAMIPWRARRQARTTFLTEASLNVVDDPELLDLMVQAGFKRLFVGIESPQEASLAECAKVQNTQRDLAGAVRTIHRAGIEVMGGFIVGFDSDRHGIFEQHWRFIQETGVVTAMVGLLTALPGTQLFTRLTREGRILGHSTGNNLDGVLNFVPRLDRQALIDGYRRLMQRLYSPREYYQRILTFLRDYRPAGPRVGLSRQDIAAFFRSLWVQGLWTRGRREYWKFVTRAFLRHRHAFAEAMHLAIVGHHFRKVAGAL